MLLSSDVQGIKLVQFIGAVHDADRRGWCTQGRPAYWCFDGPGAPTCSQRERRYIIIIHVYIFFHISYK